MRAELTLPPLDEVIANIKKMQPLSQPEELVYLMGVRNMTEAQAREFIDRIIDEEAFFNGIKKSG